jgi:hypothetical protein
MTLLWDHDPAPLYCSVWSLAGVDMRVRRTSTTGQDMSAASASALDFVEAVARAHAWPRCGAGSSGRLPSRHTLIRLPAVGLGEALRIGCATAAGELLVCMHAHDVSLPDRPQRQVTLLARQPSVAVVGTAVTHVGPAGAPIKTGCEDLDLWLRLAERYELANLIEPLLPYRIHPRQMTVRTDVAADHWRRSARIALRHPRRAGLFRAVLRARVQRGGGTRMAKVRDLIRLPARSRAARDGGPAG